MPDILTITLNPTVDMSTRVEQLVPGPKLRCDAPEVDPGGGGLNVSRTIRILGGASRAFAAIGGGTGQRLAELLREEGVDLLPFRITGETRQSLAVTEEATGRQYRFVLPGPEWSREQADRALAELGATVRRGSIAVLSGSQPPGVADDFVRRLAARTRVRQALLVADTSGPPLRYLADNPIGLHSLRMDAAEAEALAGHPLPERRDTADFAASLVRAGVAQVVIISRGADGSTLADGERRLHCSRSVEGEQVRSSIGAGDSFVGAYVLALSRGAELAEALRLGVAAASAAVLTDATELCRREDTERLLPGCEMAEL